MTTSAGECLDPCADERLACLAQEHRRTTLVFVNTRRLAEGLARHVSERLVEIDPAAAASLSGH